MKLTYEIVLEIRRKASVRRGMAAIVILCDDYLAKCEELKGLRWEYNDLLRFGKLQGEISRDAIAAMDLRLLRLGEEMAQQLKAENLALKSSSYRVDQQDGE